MISKNERKCKEELIALSQAGALAIFHYSHVRTLAPHVIANEVKRSVPYLPLRLFSSVRDHFALLVMTGAVLFPPPIFHAHEIISVLHTS
jgi:hypothetical protein